MAKADIGKRVLAYIVDCIVATVVCLAIIAVSFVIFMAGILTESALSCLTSIVYVVGLFVGLVLGFGYELLRDGFFGGRSLGKKLMGLKVVNTKTGKPCSIKDSILRNITLFIPVVNLIEIVMPFIDAEGLRFGDKLAGTKVE